MAAPQPGAVINLLLIVICGAGGWLGAAFLKPAPAAKGGSSVTAALGQGHEPGVFAADARALMLAPSAGAAEFDDLVARYGSGSAGLEQLAFTLMEKWAAADPESARTAGLSRCLTHAPEALPHAVAALAKHPGTAPAPLLAAIPSGAVLEPAVLAAAAAWGEAGRADCLEAAATLSRRARTLLITEWHRARGLVDGAAAAKSAAGLTDADDREAATAGTFLARAVTEPEITLRAAASRDDFPSIAETAALHWLPRNPGAAWAFALSMKDSPRLTDLTVALLKAEAARRRLTEAMPEIQSQLARLLPAGPPLETTAVLLPALAAERTAAATKYADSLPKDLQPQASVVLFDVLCQADPAAAWSLAESIAQETRKDQRSTTLWTSGAARLSATPAERIAQGFPDLTDMTALALAWVQSDTPAALTAFLGPGVQPALHKLVIETALSPRGAGIPREQLAAWAASQPPHVQLTVQALTSPPGK